MTFTECLSRIPAPDEGARLACLRRWDAVAKPLHSLGLLETLTARMAAVQRTDHPRASRKHVVVFCADNGVVAEGVSQSDSSVTAAVAGALAGGSSNVNIMACCAGATVTAWDAGMAADLALPGLRVRKCAHGTADLARGPAMTREQAVFALETGIAAVEEAAAAGCDILVAGEMGIGNTTSSTAVLCATLGLDPADVTGRGGGLSDAGLDRKIAVIRRCLEVNRPDGTDGLDVLCKCGGFDIAAICGAYLAGAALGIPCVMDGLISGAAAMLAQRICPDAAAALLPSHMSHEPGGHAALDALGLRAPIVAEMALGEGTGGVALLPLLDMALAVLNGEHSFASIGMDAYTEQ